MENHRCPKTILKLRILGASFKLKPSSDFYWTAMMGNNLKRSEIAQIVKIFGEQLLKP